MKALGLVGLLMMGPAFAGYDCDTIVSVGKSFNFKIQGKALTAVLKKGEAVEASFKGSLAARAPVEAGINQSTYDLLDEKATAATAILTYRNTGGRAGIKTVTGISASVKLTYLGTDEYFGCRYAVE